MKEFCAVPLSNRRILAEMLRRGVAIAIGVMVFGVSFASELSLEERIAGQRAIERVYYGHQDGATRPFEEAVPESHTRSKVESDLRKAAALERRWNRTITPAMLRSELERMSAQSRIPARLAELEAALGNDPVLIAECLVRPILIERLIRSEFTGDTRIAPADRREFDRWWSANATTFEPLASFAAVNIGPLPPVTSGRTASSVVDDTWDNASLDDIPLRRFDPAVVWTGSFMVVWGGWATQNNDPVSTGGRYDPATDAWLPVTSVSAPSARMSMAFVWTGKEMVVWGGTVAGNTTTNSGFRYDPVVDAWSPMAASPMPGRDGSKAVWTGTRVLIWGGNGTAGAGASYDPANDVWTGSLSTVNEPAMRAGHSAVWTGSRMLVWGGEGPLGYFQDGGIYDPIGNSWQTMSLSGAPSQRTGQATAWTGTEMLVWGGSYFGSELGTGGRFNPGSNAWTAMSNVSAPAARYAHSGVWTGSRFIVWGGYGVIPLNSGGSYDPSTNTWSATTLVGAPPDRIYHVSVWTGSRMLIWGGSAEVGGRYDAQSDSWTEMSLNVPKPRYSHTAVWTGTYLIVWEGTDASANEPHDGARYDPVLDVWLPISKTNQPAHRWDHTAVWTGSQMIVWGGQNYRNDGGRYDPILDMWQSIAPTTLSGRHEHTVVWTGTEMIVWGGKNLNDSGFGPGRGARYNPVTNSWTLMTTVNAPWTRTMHTAVWTGREMIVWGGNAQNAAATATGGRYDPVTDTWTATSMTSAPLSRQDHGAVWTGKRMIVWGGFHGVNGAVATGGIYDPRMNTWASMATTPLISGGTAVRTVWTGARMLAWGVQMPGGGSRYDPIADAWSPMSVTNVPGPRGIDFSMTLTGPRTLVWGGTRSWYGALRDGGAYISDADLDGWGDGEDNCPTIANASQADADADNAGDACDNCPGLLNVGQDDIDEDGVGTACDNCPQTGNAGQADVDGDAHGDVCDCAPSDGTAFAISAEIGGVVFPNRTTLAWQGTTSGGSVTTYDVLRGDIFAFPVGSGSDTCPGPSVSGTSIAETTVVAPGTGYWFIVRGRNACGAGSYGQGNGGPRTSAGCP